MCRWDNLAEDGETVQLCVTAWWSEATPAAMRIDKRSDLEEVELLPGMMGLNLFEVLW